MYAGLRFPLRRWRPGQVFGKEDFMEQLSQVFLEFIASWGYFAVAVLMVTVIINSIITIVAPVNDGFYYVGDAICIVGLVLASIFMLRMYNLSTTRPLPKLFDRKEVQ